MGPSSGRTARPTVELPVSLPCDAAAVEPIRASDLQMFVVDRKVAESDSVVSFYLVPKAGGEIPKFLPGQFLTLYLDLPGTDKPMIRTYTASDCWRPGGYRISVKRERSNFPDHPDGQASNYLHDRIQPGDCLRLRLPRGAFVIDRESDQPVVLLSAGVGITPMISMLNAIIELQGRRKVWFIHGCRHGGEYAFGGHLGTCAAGYPHLSRIVCFSRPREHDVKGKAYDFKGRVTLDLLRKSLPFDGYEFYLCGPGEFIAQLHAGLNDMGISPSRLHYEFFAQRKSLKQGLGPDLDNGPAVSNGGQRGENQVSTTAAQALQVRFLRSGLNVTWNGAYGNLLELAEAMDLTPNFSCRSGICETCMCGLLNGEVEYVNEPLERPGEGQVLLCSAKPASDIELDL